MKGIANPEGLRRDNDLQLPAVLFSILDKSTGRNEEKEEEKGWEERREDVEGDIREEQKGKKNTNGGRAESNHTGAVRKERRRGDKRRNRAGAEDRCNFIHCSPLEGTPLLPGITLLLLICYL